MADANILQLSAAAGRRRSFAASQKKGSSAPAPKAPQAPGSPGAGPVAGLTALNKAPPVPHASVGPNGGPTSPAPAGGPSPYLQHAVALSNIAHQNGAPQLSSAIRAVAAVPHPADKAQVAKNYLSTQPPAVAQQHAHMFTNTLMNGGGQ